MKTHNRHTKDTKKRLRAQAKRLMEWVTALTALFGLVKLVVEIIKLLH